MVAIKLVDHVEIEKVAQPQILRLIRFEQVETQRLKNQTAVNNIARAHVVLVTLHQVRRHGIELHAPSSRLLVPPDFKLHIVMFEFSLDHLRHLDVFAFEIHVAVTRDWMIIDSK